LSSGSRVTDHCWVVDWVIHSRFRWVRHADRSDMRQEGMLALTLAAGRYDRPEVPFRAFAVLFVTRHLMTWVRGVRRFARRTRFCSTVPPPQAWDRTPDWENAELVRLILAGLPPEHEHLLRQVGGGRLVKDVSAEVGKTPGAAWACYWRLINRLRVRHEVL
jgi:DNA-directed RNA polymerase specialized sigma24 family protein